MAKQSDYKWEAPVERDLPELHVYNSITRKKEKFIPKEDVVTWYSCGPTTYDEAHMGHARCYISVDIVRRVLQDYFNYPIFFVMNITDIDDKIIKRARTKHLLENYKLKSHGEGQVLEDIAQAFELHEKTIAATEDPDKRKMLVDEIEKAKLAVEPMKMCYNNKDCSKSDVAKCLDELLSASEAVLGEWLDKQQGHTVKDNDIFIKLPRHFEERFNEDMKALNVLGADVVTRVSEYVPQIVAFVERVVELGFAYAAEGSVYFDVAKFHANPNHSYAKLVPEAFGNTDALQEGEGVLSGAASGKRNATDFALWKSSRPGEPSWPSLWGPGRPGWHIECSVMAADTLGEHLDIHTGGVDLKFPHHDNEMAQSEAYFGCKQWATYFLHSGHLNIEGCKMSKSLKNFITIQEALEQYSADQLRTAFLMHSWKDTLDYSTNTMEGARQFLKMVSEFCLNVDDTLRRSVAEPTTWTEREKTLSEAYRKTRVNVHSSLCDNIDTRSALDSLRELISDVNKYMKGAEKLNSHLLLKTKNLVCHLLRMFGLVLEEGCHNDNQTDDRLISVAEVVGEVRSRLRTLSRQPEGNADLSRQLLSLCDEIRDQMLPPLGVRLEDREQGPPSIKLVDPEALVKEIELKQKQDEEKRQQKEKKKREAEEKKNKEAAQMEEDMAAPELLFRTAEFTAWNENGLPTKRADDQDIAKSQVKKMTKTLDAYKKKYEKWMAKKTQA